MLQAATRAKGCCHSQQALYGRRAQPHHHLRVVHRSAYSQDSATGSTQDANYQVLQTFFIGRAFAVTLSRRLGEAVVDVVSEVSKIIAENPKRVQEFQDEVMALAQQEMRDSNTPVMTITGSSSSSSSSSSNGSSSKDSSSGSTAAAPQDLQAIVDDLRAEIASSRAELQQVKAAVQATPELN